MKFNILNFNEKEMSGIFQKKYRDKSFFSRYIKFYYLLTFPEILALVISSILSYKWWSSFEILENDYGFLFATIATCCISITIFLLTNHLASLWLSERKIDEFIIPLLFLIIFNIYTDWNGVTPLAETVYEKPVFAQQKEDSLSATISQILLSYRWCSAHNAKHKVNELCEHTYVPSSAGQLLSSYEKYGYEPETDKKTISLLQEQINRLNQDYSEDKVITETKRKHFVKTGRGGTIACLIIFLFCGIWKHTFAGKVAFSSNPSPNPTPPPSMKNLNFPEIENLDTSIIKDTLPKNGQSLNNTAIKGKTDISMSTTVLNSNKGYLEERICSADQCENTFVVDLRKEVPGRNKRKYCGSECSTRMRLKMNKINKLKKKKWIVHSNNHKHSTNIEHFKTKQTTV